MRTEVRIAEKCSPGSQLFPRTRPQKSPYSWWTLEKVGDLINEMRPANLKLQASTFINRADPRGADNDEAAEILREQDALTFLDAPLGNRKAFGNAAAHGMSVTELRPKDPKAIDEVETLLQRVYDVIETSQPESNKEVL